MRPRLSNATLAELPANVRRPQYDRSALKTGVLHIGLGAFHRAHQAPVFQALAEEGDLRWGVIGASLQSPSVRDTLASQDFLYTLAVDDGDARDISVINVIRGALVAPEDPSRLVSAIASSEVKIVTVTVTEKGYKLDASGALAVNDNAVASDMASLDAPTTMPGIIAAGMLERRRRRLPPLTIISCDNIAGNGLKLGSSVTQIAAAHDASGAKWIREECAFPATMVDRIVPATRDADIDAISAQIGATDCATVRTEPFSRWVIENRFAGERPDFEAAGAQITNDIAPWEQAKLRLLNGAHSTMAYVGLLAGIATVDRLVEQPWGKALVERLWDEVSPTLSPSPGLDIGQYRQTLMKRFGNSALGHRLQQIAMDGSQKLPQRLVRPALDLIERGRSPAAVSFAIAAWIRCQSGRSDRGENFTVDDPLAQTTARICAGSSDPRDLAVVMLGLEAVFPRRLARDDPFVSQVARHLDAFQRLGAQSAVQRLLEDRG
jgi:fructuronate reductase